MLPDEPGPQSDKTHGSEPEISGDQADLPSERKRLPAGWRPEHASRKGPLHVFVDEPDPNVTPSLFADKRYGTFRKQMTLAVGVAVFFIALFAILYWLRPLFFPSETRPSLDAAEPAKEAASSSSGSARD